MHLITDEGFRDDDPYALFNNGINILNSPQILEFHVSTLGPQTGEILKVPKVLK